MVSREEYEDLLERVEALELINDTALFSCYMGKLSRPTIYFCIEEAVARYFNISRTLFYDTLLVGNKNGRRHRLLPKDPIHMDEEDRLIVARQCLYGILHVDFHVSIPLLRDCYNVNPSTYINKWRDRYIRIFYGNESGNFSGKDDEAYERYWRGIHKLAVEVSIENGMYDELIAQLDKDGLIYNRLVTWRTKQIGI